MLVAYCAVVGGDANAVQRVAGLRIHGLELVDQVAHCQCMQLGGTEDDGLLKRVDQAHEELDAVGLAFLDLDGPVEVLLFVAPALFDVAGHHVVVGRVDVLVQGGGNLLHPERRQVAVVDAVAQRVRVHRLAEVGIGVGVEGALRRGGQAQLHGRREVVQDRAPRTLVPGAAAVALVNDDEVEEVARVFAEVRLGLTVSARAAHKGLEDGEEDAAVFRHLALLADVVWRYANQRIVGEG